MKRPSRSFVLYLLGMGLLGLGGLAVYQNARSAPEGVRLREGFFGALFHRGRKERPVTAADRENMKRQQAQLKRQLLEEFPILRIEQRPVPDEQNGFLQILRLGKNPGFYQLESGVMDELSACLYPWDSEKARAFLEKHPGFVAEAERIAALPAQSSTLSAADYNGFFGARSAKSLHDVFLLQARLAAESGNEAGALEAMRHARQLHSHLHGAEEPSLLVETVVILMDMGRMRLVIDSILPQLGPDADLAAWRDVIAGETNVPARLAEVLRGEWNTSADHLFLPMALKEHHDGNLKDPEEIARVWSDGMARWIEKLEGRPATGFQDLSSPDETHRSDALTKEEKEIVDVMGIGASAWSKGLLRSAVMSAQHRAVLDRLIHERDGGLISDILEPVSGLPFRFDPVTRTIYAPEWSGAPENVQPLKLPW